MRFYLNHIMILLGFQQSIASLLRDWLLSAPDVSNDPSNQSSLASHLGKFIGTPTTAAYIILSDGQKTYILEKDRVKAVTITSEDFAVATNHDVADEGSKPRASQDDDHNDSALAIAGMKTLVEESMERKEKISALRTKTLRRVASRKRRKEQLVEGISLKVCHSLCWLLRDDRSPKSTDLVGHYKMAGHAPNQERRNSFRNDYGSNERPNFVDQALPFLIRYRR